ncbi:hypothetical protein Ae201684P_010755 [Aphanomyces euteiches]|nr:hypothetical protein Ae201684P_010755 [Aphanomyces euteiches]
MEDELEEMNEELIQVMQDEVELLEKELERLKKGATPRSVAVATARAKIRNVNSSKHGWPLGLTHILFNRADRTTWK